MNNLIVPARPSLNQIMQDALDNNQKLELIIVSNTHWYLKIAQPKG